MGSVAQAGATGAIAGAVTAVPTAGLGPLAVAGITSGISAAGQFINGVFDNIAAQKSDLISGKRTELTQRKKALNNYI